MINILWPEAVSELTRVKEACCCLRSFEGTSAVEAVRGPSTAGHLHLCTRERPPENSALERLLDRGLGGMSGVLRLLGTEHPARRERCCKFEL